MQNLPNIAVVLIFIALSVFITNFASNVAVCNVITPIAMTLVSVKYLSQLWHIKNIHNFIKFKLFRELSSIVIL